MYCENCGTQLTGTETKCPYCGIALRPIAAVSAPPAQPVTGTNGQNSAPPAGGTPGTNPGMPAANGQNGSAPNAQPPSGNVYPQSGFCTRCGQKLQPGAAACSFCGQPVGSAPQGIPYRPPYVPGQSTAPYPVYTQPPIPAPKKRGTALSVTALTMVILAWIFLFTAVEALVSLFIILPFVSLGLGIAGTVQGAKSRNTAALVTGILAIVLSAIACFMIIYVFILVGAMLTDPSYGNPYETFAYLIGR